MSAARILGRSLRSSAAATVTATLLVLCSGCTTLGANIAGDFSCRAPDGLCAASSTIDDRALAMISGEAGDVVIPAGPYVDPSAPPRATRTALAAPGDGSPRASAARTREKVLRIVFQPYIDERGRLHEASAVHVVVEGEWQAQALADATQIPDRAGAPRPSSLSLADAVDREAHGADPSDPTLPDPAVVAAARARARDPVAAIKADVAQRLSRQPGRVPAAARRSTAAVPTAVPVAVRSRQPSDALVSAAGAPPAAPTAPHRRPTGAAPAAIPARQVAAPLAPAVQASPAGPAGETSGPKAIARVKESEAYRDAKARAEASAREAAASAGSAAGPTVRATSFPATIPEDN